MGIGGTVKKICATKKWESHISIENARNAERRWTIAARFPKGVEKSNGNDDFVKFQLDYELQVSEVVLLKDQLRVTDDTGERCCSYCYVNESALGRGLRLCKGCRVALYCTRRCAKRDWRRGNHKHLCKRIQKLSERERQCPTLVDMSTSEEEW